MIRRLFLLALLAICSHCLFGQSYYHRMDTAIDLGTHSGPFSYEETFDMRIYSDDYSCQKPESDYFSSNDVFFKLTVATSSIELYSRADCSYIHVLDASGNEIDHIDLGRADYYRGLLPGTYYLVYESSGTDVTIRIRGEERVIGEDFYCPLDLGNFGEEFTVSHTANIAYYEPDYIPGTTPWGYDHDMVYRFTLLQPRLLSLENDLKDAHTILKRSEDETMMPVYVSSDGNQHYELEAGTYYVYTWIHTTYGSCYQTICLKGTSLPVGSDFSSPIDITGEYYGNNFWYNNTFDTSAFAGSKMSEKAGNEVYYRITFTEPMELDIYNCDSEVNDTYLMVYSSEKKLLYANDRTEGRGACTNVDHAYIQIPFLLPGTYYIVVDGSTNGNINLFINGLLSGPIGDKLGTAIDVGTYDGGFLFTDTRDTSLEYTHQFTGKSTNDIFYKLTLTNAMDLKISHCGSVLADTYLSILNSDKVIIYSNDNYTGEGQCGSTENALIKVSGLPAGTYYIVSEGNSENGMITTNIEASRGNETLSPTMSQPHIISFVPTIATDDVFSLGTGDIRHEIQYYDYYGNPTLKVQHGFSPYGMDIFTLQEYDGLGRQSNLWLPITKGNNDGSYANPASLKDAATFFFLYGKDSHPYSRIVYDGSALNEIVEQYGPGSAWHTGSKSVKTDRMTNLNQEGGPYANVLIYQSTTGDTGVNALANHGTYIEGELYVTKTTDEDGHISYEFKDKTDRVILTRQMDGDQLHDTYMVYDNYGNVRFMLPPMATDCLTENRTYNENHSALQKYAYIYQYDKYNRCIYKKLPGCAPIYTIYDAADRPIFTQDGEQRDRNEWSFSVPDAFGRIVLTGTCKNQLDYDVELGALDTLAVKATWVNEDNELKGYSVAGVSLDTPTVLSANYYDNYEFLGRNGILDNATTAYAEAADYGKRYSGGCKGQRTGSWSARFTDRPTGFIYSVLYYDERYRVIQQRGNNELGGTETVYTDYNFEGSPAKEKHIHSIPEKGEVTEIRQCTYDLANRLKKVTYWLNDNDPIILVDNVYDELGRLLIEKRNGEPKLKTDYTYNLRSWIKRINNPLFNQTLNYQETLGGIIPCYNGNISHMLWHSVENGAGTVAGSPDRGYSFTYDGFSRLKDAVYGEGTSLLHNQNRFNEQITGYDKMGNILGLLRYGQIGIESYGLVDNLNLTYDGNQLQSVYDNATNSVFGNGLEFKDDASEAVEYEYDKNGNLTKDLNKKTTGIQYNILNLPSHITFADGNSIEYEYAADGSKVRTTHIINNDTTTTTYCGNAIYENGVLNMLLNESGYYNPSVNTFHFYLKDHQGNVRVVADETGNVAEANDYYPFGGLISNAGNSIQTYKYNGKELDRKSELNWYDYGARHYDAALGRWHVLDPASEEYHSLSPYVYCFNIPVKFIDPSGEKPTIYEAALMSKHVYGDKVELAGGWKVSDRAYQGMTSINGLQSALYERSIGGVTEYTYATAGTQLTDWGDLKEDATQLWGDTKQYGESTKMAERIAGDLNDAELTFVGHSLGGGLAAANALKTDKNAITFNPAAITPATKQALGLSSAAQKGSILNVVVKGEIVDYMQSSIGLKPDGKRYELKASYLPFKSEANTLLRIKNHSIDTVIQKLK